MRGLPIHRFALGLLLAAAATGPMAVPVAAQRPEVAELRFEGAKSFSRTELASAISTSATRCPLVYRPVCWTGLGKERAYLETGALEADALRLRVYYYERGFREAQVSADTTRVGDHAVRVTFRIREGRPVRVAGVDVAGAPDELAERALPLAAGDLFDVVAYEAGRDTLLSRLRDRGFARAQVLVGYRISRERPYDATVSYEVVPGTAAKFGRVTVEGTEDASPELVRRMLTFREGDVYDRSAILESQRNLYGLQIFRHAEVQADLEAEPDSVVPITVQVAEGPMRQVRVGGGLNNVECGNVEGRWTSRNFMGEGRRLEVRGRVGNLLIDRLCDNVSLLRGAYTAYDSLTGLVSVDFTQPWFFGPRNSIGVGLFAERRSVPEVFVRTAVGGYLSVGRSLGRNAQLTLAYRPEWTLLGTEGNLFFCVNFVACTFEDVSVLQDPHWLSPITLSLAVDRTDAVFTPSRGYVLRADLEQAGRYTGSDFAYTRLTGEASRYTGSPGGVILALRARGGIAWPHGGSEGSGSLRLNPQKRFFAGGPNSVRGFDQYRLGPTVLGIDAVPWLAQSQAVGGAGCSMTSINDGSCDARPLDDARFFLRPAGGEVLLEGNAELRFPLPLLGGKLRGAAFVDAGQVWRTASDVALSEIVATPGVGIRYYSPVGPIRIDAGFNTQGPQTLTVLTTRVESCFKGSPGCEELSDPRQLLRNTDTVVQLGQRVRYGQSLSDIASWGDFFRRFKIHFSIGQAF